MSNNFEKLNAKQKVSTNLGLKKSLAKAFTNNGNSKIEIISVNEIPGQSWSTYLIKLKVENQKEDNQEN